MTAIPELTIAELARFRSKLFLGGCGVQWGGPVNNQGYGRFEIYRNGQRVRVLAHRLAYKLATGEDPGAQFVRHGCDTPPCCTPDCLSPGSQTDNMRDAASRGRVDLTGLRAYSDARNARVDERTKAGIKRCSRCRAVKPLAEFSRASRSRDGRAGWCAACHVSHKAAQRRQRRAA